MVRIKVITALVALLTGHWAMAQNPDLTVNMSVPMPNILHWDDIWNVTIDNNFPGMSQMPTTIDITVALEMRGIVYEAVTEKFIIPMGITILNADIARTRNLKILTEDPVHKTFFTRYREMKDGAYRLCVTLRLYDLFGPGPYTTSDCLFHEVSHPGIIILNTPLDRDTVMSELLQFTWAHVNESSSILQPSYVLDLVQILPGQSPETAIALNPRRLSVDRLAEPVLDYPQIERPLDTGQVYAWRVIAYTDTRSTTSDQDGKSLFNSGANERRKEIARSDVNYFVCGTTENTSPIKLQAYPPKYFIDMEHWSENQTYFFSSTLPLSLRNPYGRRNLSYRIYNDKHELIKIPSPIISLEPGVNNIYIDLSSEHLPAGQFYFAELRLSEGHQYHLKLFKQKP